jgi:hypothetical protein
MPWTAMSWSGILLLAVGSLTLSAAGFLVVGAILIQLPADYFSTSRSREFWTDAHPVARWAGLILKNAAGAALVVLGVVLAMPGVPGPGTLILLMGLLMMDFPGKVRLEQWLIRRPGIFAAINRLRRRYGKCPFDVGGASRKNPAASLQAADSCSDIAPRV